MQTLDTLKAQAATLPESVRANALKLIDVMGTPVEGIGDEPTPWKPPFLRLVQGTTDRGSIPKGTGIGEFVLGEEKLEQPLHFVPIRIWDSRQYWDPDQTSNKILCSSPDAKVGYAFGECKTCPHAVWKEGEGSDCGKGKNVIAITSDLSRIFTVGFYKSNFKIGTELEGYLKKAAVNTYARTYGLSSATNSTAKAVENYKIEVLDDKARRTPEEHLPFLRELFTMVSADRKSNLDVFYENMARKRDLQALAVNAAPTLENSTVTTVEPAEATVTEVKATVNKGAVNSMAKGYTV